MNRTAREKMLLENRIIIGLLGILTAISLGFVLYQIRSIILAVSVGGFYGIYSKSCDQFF